MRERQVGKRWRGEERWVRSCTHMKKIISLNIHIKLSDSEQHSGLRYLKLILRISGKDTVSEWAIVRG